MTPCDRLVHPALEAPAGGASQRSLRVSLTDRARLGVVLQAAALLSHLEAAGLRLADGWRRAAVDSAGRLRGVAAGPGPAELRAGRRLAELAARLFAGDPALCGRGEARAALRRLVAGWRRELIDTRPDRAVEQLLDTARPLWRDEFGPARAALAAVLVVDGRSGSRIAGPRWFDQAVRGRAATPARIEALLASAHAFSLWHRPPRPVSPAARRRVALAGAVRAGAVRDGVGRLESAHLLYFGGHFKVALECLSELDGDAAAILRARCLLWLERPAAAWRLLQSLGEGGPRPRAQLELARVAVAALGRSGRGARAAVRAQGVARALPSWLRPEAHLLAAEVAARRRDPAALRRHLRRSRVVLEQPELAWRWYRAAGAGAVAYGRGATAAGFYARALASWRRRLPTFEAARLWAGIARGRQMAGDLAAAERAATHAVRLHARGGEPPRTRRCVWALAEIRLRRGRPRRLAPLISGVSGVSGVAGPPTSRAALAARLDLVRGRPERAVEELARRRGDPLEGELAALAARALGWLGRSRRAHRMLSRRGASRARWFEPEERPALWALAGDRRRARAAAVGPTVALWRSLLAGDRPQPDSWDAVDELGTYRAARLVYDIELVAPGVCSAGRLERAARRLTRAGAVSLAARLEVADRSAWEVVASFLADGSPDAAGLRSLLSGAAPGARLSFERRGERIVLVDGAGGAVELEAPSDGGRFILASRRNHPRLSALVRLIAERWPPPGGRERSAPGGIVGESPLLRAALERSAALAPSDLPILVLGETGTGKELLSRRVHALSTRASGPFLAINCAALARDLLLSDLFGHRRGSFTGADRDRAGVFESAGGGTVFLDEIGDLPPAAQGALLRVLQEREVRRIGESSPRRVDARLVAATHRDLATLVRQGRFRRDLFFRLEAASIELPPLRRRGADVVLLAEHFLRRSRSGAGVALSPAARAKLEAHSWPGNVRELENALAVAVAMAAGGAIETRHLTLGGSGDGGGGLGYHARVARYRRRLVEEALEASGGNRAAAARRMGLSRQAMTYLVRSLGVQPGVFEPRSARSGGP